MRTPRDARTTWPRCSPKSSRSAPSFSIAPSEGLIHMWRRRRSTMGRGSSGCRATGHLSLAEIRALLDESVRIGVKRFIVTHANWALCRLDLDVQRELVAKGASLEYVACSCVSPIFHEQEPKELASWIKEFKGENLVLGSDLGQMSGPPH